MPQTSFVAHEPATGAVSLVDSPIIVDREDFEGIHVAAASLAGDIARVTGGKAPTITPEKSPSPCVIIVGSIQRSKLVQELVSRGVIDITAIEGEWETWCTGLVEAPWNGCANALVICGSDKRGTIFGVYSMSEEIGVSP